MNTWIWMPIIPQKARHGTVLVIRSGDRRISSTMMTSLCNPLMSLRESKGSCHKINGAKKQEAISSVDPDFHIQGHTRTGTHVYLHYLHTCTHMHTNMHSHVSYKHMKNRRKRSDSWGLAVLFSVERHGMWSLCAKRSRLTFLRTKRFNWQKNN